MFDYQRVSSLCALLNCATLVLKNSGTRFCYFLLSFHIIVMRARILNSLPRLEKKKVIPQTAADLLEILTYISNPFPLTENVPETQEFIIGSIHFAVRCCWCQGS